MAWCWRRCLLCVKIILFASWLHPAEWLLLPYIFTRLRRLVVDELYHDRNWQPNVNNNSLAIQERNLQRQYIHSFIRLTSLSLLCSTNLKPGNKFLSPFTSTNAKFAAGMHAIPPCLRMNDIFRFQLHVPRHTQSIVNLLHGLQPPPATHQPPLPLIGNMPPMCNSVSSLSWLLLLLLPTSMIDTSNSRSTAAPVNRHLLHMSWKRSTLRESMN